MTSIDRLRVLLGLGERRLGGDRRRPRETAEAEARAELEDLAWVKWPGARVPLELGPDQRVMVDP